MPRVKQKIRINDCRSNVLNEYYRIVMDVDKLINMIVNNIDLLSIYCDPIDLTV